VADVSGFLAAFRECFGPVLPVLPKRRGRRPRVPLAKVLPALVYHFMSAAGTLAEHGAQLYADGLCESSFSERRARMPWEVFAELLRLGLRPLARAVTEPAAFWRGWRLVALDGTQFSLTNTPQVKATVRKAKTRRGRAAFAKITTGVLLELGLHNPLAAAIGRNGQSEWALALELLGQLPAGALLLADRLHGCAAFVAQVLAACARTGGHFLIRARSRVRVQTLRRFKDGSRLVRVPVQQKGNQRVITQWLELREIRVCVQRAGHRAQELRLWTSLLAPRPGNWQNFTRGAGNMSCITGNSNGSCARARYCKAIRWKPAPRKSRRWCWPAPCWPGNGPGRPAAARQSCA
jgi:hypothetical protein